MTSVSPTASTYLRRLIPAALIAAAATLGGSAIGEPATACAETREWDIDAFDKCVMSGQGQVPDEKKRDHYQYCCLTSGGDWNDEIGGCQAPPADAPNPAQPGVVAPPLAGATENPAPPPVTAPSPGVAENPSIWNPPMTTATFQPAPGRR